MPDISMCKDHECPSRMICYRYRAKPSNFQSYAGFKHEGLQCVSYISVSGRWDSELVSRSEMIENSDEETGNG